jgi:uncharacterized membrane protein YgdD (TMEM256/DUF423 family)
MPNSSFFLKAGSFLGASAVGLGAFGAHAFKPYLLSIDRLATFETAVQYHFYGAFFLLVCSLLFDKFNNSKLVWAGYLYLFGTIIFSGALYLICLANKSVFGAIAPIGGVCLICGWLALFLAAKKSMD